MSPETYNEKAETIIPSTANPNRGRFFSRRKPDESVNDDEKIDDDATEVDAPVSKALAPVSFTELFRYVRVHCSSVMW